MRILKLFFFFGLSTLSMYSQVNFEMYFNFEKASNEDELINLQLFDYNGDGDEEIIGSFNSQNNFRIICYSQNGDILNTFTQQFDNNEHLGNSCTFYGQNNEKMIILAFKEYEFPGSVFKLKVFNFDAFTIVDSFNYDIGEYFYVDQVNQIIAPNFDNGNIFYVGVNRYLPDYADVTQTITYKFDFSNEQIEFLEEIDNYGSYFAKHSDNDFITTLGNRIVNGVEAWPYTTRSYKFGLISNNYLSNVQLVFSTSGSAVGSEPPSFSNFPSNFQIISHNDNNYHNYGPMFYYRSSDSTDGTFNHFKCYESDSLDLLWELDESYMESGYIYASTCIMANSENHYVMYFMSDQLEIRNRINGEIVHQQDSSISPFQIERNSEDELLFFVEQEDETGYDVYILDGEILVSKDENQITNIHTGLYNYPNPFNPSTTISFSIQNNSNVEVTIFNILGQKVKLLSKAFFKSGEHSIIWNGNNDMGVKVCTGIYLYKLDVNGKTKDINQCILLK